MKSPASQPPRAQPDEPAGFPGADELAALRAWYEGLGARDAVARYLGDTRHAGASSRGVLSGIRKRLASFARSRHQNDLAVLFVHRSQDRAQQVRCVLQAIEALRTAPAPSPLAGDDIDRWLDPRTAKALRAHGIQALADLSVRMVRRRSAAFLPRNQ